MNILLALLRDGYFPSQLPPAFNTKRLARHRDDLIKAFPDNQPSQKAGVAESFSQARTGYLRRPLAIPNPINHIYLCKEISMHWRKIHNHMRQSKISESKSQISNASGRAIDFTSISRLRELRLLRSAGFRYILQSDISQFFPTLYTHVIPWALHTKSVAKKNINKYSAAFFGNRLDRCLRRCQSNQTIGIPIGPDTSHIISEIVGISIDLIICEQLGRWPIGYRHVDDFFFCFDTYREAEKGLSAIVRALREFELHINPTKTRIVSVSEFDEENWAHILARKEISQDRGKQKSDIVDYFESMFELCKRYDDESIIKFAVKRSASFLIWNENWDMYQAYISKIATVFPNNLQTVAQTLTTYKQLGYNINSDLVTKLCNSIIIDHSPLEHHSEIAWALWLAREFDVQITENAARALSTVRSSVCALIALDLRERSQIKAGLETDMWVAETTRPGLLRDLWLFAYEAPYQGWITPMEHNHIINHPEFSELLTKNVSFYDTNRKLEPFITKTKLPEEMEAEWGQLFDIHDEEFGYDFSEELEEYID